MRKHWQQTSSTILAHSPLKWDGIIDFVDKYQIQIQFTIVYRENLGQPHSRPHRHVDCIQFAIRNDPKITDSWKLRSILFDPSNETLWATVSYPFWVR